MARKKSTSTGMAPVEGHGFLKVDGHVIRKLCAYSLGGGLLCDRYGTIAQGSSGPYFCSDHAFVILGQSPVVTSKDEGRVHLQAIREMLIPARRAIAQRQAEIETKRAARHREPGEDETEPTEERT